MSITLVSPREQDLEREVAELTERLAYANSVIEQRNAMVSSLHAELADTAELNAQCKSIVSSLYAEIDAMKSQTPDMWVAFDDGGIYSYWFNEDDAALHSSDDWEPHPLYASAGAKEKTE